MKVAIIGGGPIGLECALAFQRMGAHAVLFSGSQNQGRLFALLARCWGEQPCDGSWGEITSEIGRSWLSQKKDFDLTEVPTLGEYQREYLFPLLNLDCVQSMIRPYLVDRVHKRILNPEEFIKGRSRVVDLFRVVYRLQATVDFQKQFQEQREQNPDLFHKFGKEMTSSFLEEGEQFEDFDLVVDATGPEKRFRPLGPSGCEAIGEERVASLGLVYYGYQALDHWEKICQTKRVTIVGSGAWAARGLLELSHFLEKGKIKEVTLVTSELNPFEKIEGQFSSEFTECLFSFLRSEEKFWRKNCEKTESEIRRWKELPRYERDKVARPLFPEPRLKMLGGYTVTSVDKLLDREGVFLTCETEPWRRENTSSLVTIGTDLIIGANGLRLESSLFRGLRTSYESCLSRGPARGFHEEPGFYTIGENGKGVYGLKFGLNQVQFMKEDILKFFSKA